MNPFSRSAAIARSLAVVSSVVLAACAGNPLPGQGGGEVNVACPQGVCELPSPSGIHLALILARQSGEGYLEVGTAEAVTVTVSRVGELAQTTPLLTDWVAPPASGGPDMISQSFPCRTGWTISLVIKRLAHPDWQERFYLAPS